VAPPKLKRVPVSIQTTARNWSVFVPAVTRGLWSSLDSGALYEVCAEGLLETAEWLTNRFDLAAHARVARARVAHAEDDVRSRIEDVIDGLYTACQQWQDGSSPHSGSRLPT
jgi:hypothetical protein